MTLHPRTAKTLCSVDTEMVALGIMPLDQEPLKSRVVTITILLWTRIVPSAREMVSTSTPWPRKSFGGWRVSSQVRLNPGREQPCLMPKG